MLIQVAGLIDDSRVNGPGRRVVVWVQGCTLGCLGCFNPGTHAAGVSGVAVEALVAQVLAARAPSTVGVTFSGGEPFQQAAGLAAVAAGLRAAWPEGNRMAFSGYRLEELRGPEAPAGAAALLAELDWLVDGRFDARLSPRPPWRGSANQRIWSLGRPLPPAELEGAVELQVAPDGQVLLSGFPDAKLRRALARALE